MLKTRLSAFFSLLLVFVSGTVVGVFGYRFYNSVYNPPVHAQNMPPRPEDIRKHIVTELDKAVHLDEQQLGLVNAVLDEVRSKGEEIEGRRRSEYLQIRDQQIEKIKKILRPDQEPLYEKYLADRAAERARRRAQQPGFKDIVREKDGHDHK